MAPERPPERWFALGVESRHEKVVSRILENKGLEVFLPLYRRRHYYPRRVRDFHLPLFPGYVFCRFNPKVRMPILTTPGVIQVLGVGRTPVPVEDDEITPLQAAIRAELPAEPHSYLRTGQKVRITAGVLTGVEGIVTDDNDSLRLVLSITLLQRSVSVKIDRSWVSGV